ncbi:MAG: hypothetical protein ACI4IW_06830 [Oscillospiraceae bacterium]
MENEFNENAVNLPYQISANGVYRCVKYLCNFTFYDDENGWICEPEGTKQKYSYKNILSTIRGCFLPMFNSKFDRCLKYDGSQIWNDYFLKDPYLAEKILKMKVNSIDELHYRANNAANWR